MPDLRCSVFLGLWGPEMIVRHGVRHRSSSGRRPHLGKHSVAGDVISSIDPIVQDFWTNEPCYAVRCGCRAMRCRAEASTTDTTPVSALCMVPSLVWQENRDAASITLQCLGRAIIRT